MTEPRPFTVSELTGAVKLLLEETFPDVWVVGEIGGLSRPRSGHVYLTLKDEGATISCVLWRSTAERLRFEPEEGMQVLARGRLNLYPPRGQYQLDVRALEPRGLGALQAAFERLRAKLEAEGLFAPERKRPIPRFPETIGVVTSPTGAAFRDILKVLRRRYPAVSVVLAPARVQGEGAEDEVAEGIRRLEARGGIDVLIVGRGGGSLEDLWAFNTETVARAIAGCRLPVISAVGHEVDVTIADLVADVRAPTPSAAAEIAVPSAEDLAAVLRGAAGRVSAAGVRVLRGRAERLAVLAGAYGLRRFPDRLREHSQRLDELAARAARGGRDAVARAREALAGLAGRADSLSPVRVLARGYAVVTREGAAGPLRDASALGAGDRVRTRLAAGRFVSVVERVLPEGEGR